VNFSPCLPFPPAIIWHNKGAACRVSPLLTSYLQIGPLLLVLLLFFGIPLLVVIAYSFFSSMASFGSRLRLLELRHG
jgi:ABC-type sugar transport system permease subunit